MASFFCHDLAGTKRSRLEQIVRLLLALLREICPKFFVIEERHHTLGDTAIEVLEKNSACVRDGLGNDISIAEFCLKFKIAFPKECNVPALQVSNF